MRGYRKPGPITLRLGHTPGKCLSLASVFAGIAGSPVCHTNGGVLGYLQLGLCRW
jgi:hypothetical protein